MTDQITPKTIRDLAFAATIGGLLWHSPAIIKIVSDFFTGL